MFSQVSLFSECDENVVVVVDVDAIGEADGEHHGSREPGGGGEVPPPPRQGTNSFHFKRSKGTIQQLLYGGGG